MPPTLGIGLSLMALIIDQMVEAEAKYAEKKKNKEVARGWQLRFT